MQPNWFKTALTQTPRQSACEVADATISYLHWPNPGKPGLLFVHGHAAHAHWWDFIAPAFIADYDVVAIDLSGAGDSDHRAAYSARLFASEIRAVLNDAGLKDPIIVGHSFGGTLTRITAHLYPANLAGIVIVDSLIPDRKGSRTPPPVPKHRDRVYGSEAEAMRRFRLRPPQPRPADFVLEHIARHSVRGDDSGFRFKLDQAVFAKMPADEGLPVATEMIRNLPIPVAMIYGEESRFFPAAHVDQLTACLSPDLIVSIPGAYHHVFLDEPLAFTSALKELLPLVRQKA